MYSNYSRSGERVRGRFQRASRHGWVNSFIKEVKAKSQGNLSGREVGQKIIKYDLNLLCTIMSHATTRGR